MMSKSSPSSMSEMVDPYVSFASFRDEYAAGNLITQAGSVHLDMRAYFDQPADGEFRLTYALIRDSRVVAIAIFASAPPLEGLNCFAVGYAVDETERGKGFGKEVLNKALDELRRGMGPHMGRFYVEAVVGSSNPASQRVAANVLSSSPVPGTDGVSGQPCLAYRRLIENGPG